MITSAILRATRIGDPKIHFLKSFLSGRAQGCRSLLTAPTRMLRLQGAVSPVLL